MQNGSKAIRNGVKRIEKALKWSEMVRKFDQCHGFSLHETAESYASYDSRESFESSDSNESWNDPLKSPKSAMFTLMFISQNPSKCPK